MPANSSLPAQIKSTEWDSFLRAEYRELRLSMKITTPKAVENICRSIRNSKNFYTQIVDRVDQKYGGSIPWYFLAVLHQMESGGNFTRHLHNGDSLKSRTKNAPKGRPLEPPVNCLQYTFTESAMDALTMPGKEFHLVTNWSVEHQLYLLERFNGFGYRLYRNIRSPYLWAGTNHYKAGKYVADGKWSATVVSKQAGAAGILKELGVL